MSHILLIWSKENVYYKYIDTDIGIHQKKTWFNQKK